MIRSAVFAATRGISAAAECSHKVTLPKISESHRQERREQILAAAWRCFARRGIHATSMEDIIEEAELSAGAVYTYFKGKDQIILAAISTSLERIGRLLSAVLANGEHLTPDELIYEALTVMDQFSKRKDLNFNSVIVMCWSESQTNHEVRALVRSFHPQYPKVLARTISAWQRKKIVEPCGDPVEIAKAFVSFVYGFIVQSALMGEASPELLTRGFKGLLSSRVPKRSKAKNAETDLS